MTGPNSAGSDAGRCDVCGEVATTSDGIVGMELCDNAVCLDVAWNRAFPSATTCTPYCNGPCSDECVQRGGIGPTCPDCLTIHEATAVVAVGRFDPNGPRGYRAAGPLRATREEAMRDVCALRQTSVTTPASSKGAPDD